MKIDTLYHMDCLEGMTQMEDHTVDFILCDLPYGTTACSWDSILPFDELWSHYKRLLKPNGVVALFGAEPFSTMVRMSNLQDYKYDWYWSKNNVTGFAFAKYQPMRAIETISIFNVGGTTYYPQGLERLTKPYVKERVDNGRDSIIKQDTFSNRYVQQYTNYPKNVLTFERDKHTFHPTQKPVALCEYLIKTYTKEGDLVLDHCMGSGTTAVACQNTDRHYIGFEQDETYVIQSLERLKNNVTQLNLF